MKKNMKKLASFLCMVMLVLGLTACGSGSGAEKCSVDSAMAEQLSQFLISNLTVMSEDEMQYYIDLNEDDLQSILDQSGIPMTAEAFQSVFGGFVSDADTLGEYVSTDSYTLKGDEDESTHTTELTFTDHPATLTLVFNEKGVATSATLDPVLTMGEILQRAGLNTVIGMGTVFVVLIFISFIIAMLPKVTGLVENAGKKKAAPAPEAVKTAAPAAEETLTDDLELVAVISAAIAAYTGASSDDFVVRSIRRSDKNNWKRY